VPNAKIDLAFSAFQGENKHFIAALCDELPLDSCYLSQQGQLGSDRPGACDISARFAFKDLLTALSAVKSTLDDAAGEASDPQTASLNTREADLYAALQTYYELDADDDETIYFVCDIDEDKSSAEHEVYVYTEHRVLDADHNLIVHVAQDVFDACAPDNFVGDIETQIFAIGVKKWLEGQSTTVVSSR
jgi:hypothetical protein